MKLKEMLIATGIWETFNKIGFESETIISGLTEKTDTQYRKYRWFDGKNIVHAVPSEEMLEEGFPWEEWYKDKEGVFQHHILYLKKNRFM